MCIWYRSQSSVLVQLPEQHLAGTHQLGHALRQTPVKGAEARAGPGVGRDGEKSLDRELVRPFDTQRGMRTLLVEDSLLLAPIEVRPQVDQRVDELLPALLEAEGLHGRSDLVGQDAERPALDDRVDVPARDPDRPGSAACENTCWRPPASSTRPMKATDAPVSSSASARAASAARARSWEPARSAETLANASSRSQRPVSEYPEVSKDRTYIPPADSTEAAGLCIWRRVAHSTEAFVRYSPRHARFFKQRPALAVSTTSFRGEHGARRDVEMSQGTLGLNGGQAAKHDRYGPEFPVA